MKGLVLKMFFSFLQFLKFTLCECSKPFPLKTKCFSQVTLDHPRVSYFMLLAKTTKMYVFHEVLSINCLVCVVLFDAKPLRCSHVELLAYGQASGKKTKQVQNNFHSAFSQCFNSLKTLDIFLFRFFVSFSFTSSFVESLHIIRREKAPQKAHSHHQDEHYRTGSLSQGKREEWGEGLYSEGRAKKAGTGMTGACSKESATSKENKTRARRAPLRL